MVENVGKVQLNLEYYSGKDLYSDGDVEDELLDIVQTHTADQYEEIILKKESWPILYHLSQQRQNILAWYPFKKTDKVLEIGAGCGAVTGAMLDKVEKVTAIELSKRRSLINANRHKEFDNLEILVGNFNVVEKNLKQKYDYVTLIGVLEYAELYMMCEKPHISFLEKISEHLTENGKILIAIENKLGLKYFAGCKEDHVGQYFEGIEGYSKTKGVKTFSKRELERIFDAIGFLEYEFYYPYPDYKFPTAIYTEDFLPKPQELYNNIRNFDGDRWLFFDETKAFDSILSSELFPEFSNSFFVELKKKAG